jgi:hypothetical protein
MTLNSNSVDFDADVSNLVETWLDLMRKKQHDEAKILCIDFIATYGLAFKQRIFEVDENEYNKLLILLVLVKGLHDYTQLCHITTSGDWHENNATVEEVWIKLCDCRERIKFVSQFYQGEAIERVIKDSDGLEMFFRDVFGNGSYLSPGIIMDKYLCSICHEDSRACLHVAGKLYGGRICSYRPVNPQFDHVAIVKVPKDRRCRIWSWHIQDRNEGEGSTMKAPVLTTFSVDDFLRDI